MSIDELKCLLVARSEHEKRFSCIVCMEAKLEMVSGSCQHRLCSSCLYLDNGYLKPNMQKCPLCGKSAAFPGTRPHIPEDIIGLQRYIGVRECPNKENGCTCQMWDWELGDHISVCQFNQFQTPDLRRPTYKRRWSTPEITYKARSKRSCKAEHPVGARRSSRNARS